jgi:hypothetical protein
MGFSDAAELDCSVPRRDFAEAARAFQGRAPEVATDPPRGRVVRLSLLTREFKPKHHFA